MLNLCWDQHACHMCMVKGSINCLYVSGMTHKNFIHALFCLIPTVFDALTPARSGDCYIAVLPLAHVLELLAENLMLLMGIPIVLQCLTLLVTMQSVVVGAENASLVMTPSETVSMQHAPRQDWDPLERTEH